VNGSTILSINILGDGCPSSPMLPIGIVCNNTEQACVKMDKSTISKCAICWSWRKLIGLYTWNNTTAQYDSYQDNAKY
jgi:hypothetical protein